MRCADVNVLVYAHRPESPHHAETLDWLEAARRSDEPLGLTDLALSGFVRTVTNPRIFRDPTPIEVALTFVDDLLASPAALRLAPGPRHWSVFRRLCVSLGLRGGLVTNAYLAAVAIETGATLVTTDRDFARFPGLRWQHPLDG